MKRIVPVIVFVIAATGTARAEITRFPTHVVDPGRLELDLDTEYEHSRRDLEGGGHLKQERIDSVLFAGVGIAKGLMFDAEINYLFRDNLATADASVTSDGIGDLKLGLLYSYGTRESRLFNASFDVKLDTAPRGEGGTDDVEYIPQAGLACKAGSTLPYISYAAHIRNHQAGDTHEGVLGVEIPAGKATMLDTRVIAEFHDSHGMFTSRQRYRLDLRAKMDTSKNFYVRPGVSLIYDSAANVVVDGAVVDRVRDGFGFGASLTFNWRP